MLFGIQSVRQEMEECGYKTHVCIYYGVDTEKQRIKKPTRFRVMR